MKTLTFTRRYSQIAQLVRILLGESLSDVSLRRPFHKSQRFIVIAKVPLRVKERAWVMRTFVSDVGMKPAFRLRFSACSTGMIVYRLKLTCLRLLAAISIGMGVIASAHAEERAGVLVFGRVSDDPKSQYESMKALVDYVASRMRDVGIREGRVLIARDALQMASYLRRGRVDWVSETGSGAMLLQQRADAQTLVLSERNGIRRYRTIYFARRDGEVKSLSMLRGHRIAFQNRTSTSAYFVPAMELLDMGLSMEILGSPFDTPDSNSVGYVFARTEQNIATWVHKGLVDVGTVSDLDWTNPEHVPEFFKADFAILRESAEVPRGVEMVRKSLNPEVLARLHEVLLTMGDDPAAERALQSYRQSLKYFDLDARDLKDLKRLRAGVGRVSSEIE